MEEEDVGADQGKRLAGARRSQRAKQTRSWRRGSRLSCRRPLLLLVPMKPTQAGFRTGKDRTGHTLRSQQDQSQQQHLVFATSSLHNPAIHLLLKQGQTLTEAGPSSEPDIALRALSKISSTRVVEDRSNDKVNVCFRHRIAVHRQLTTWGVV
eukprot:720927-Rhodomonas_salina.1